MCWRVEDESYYLHQLPVAICLGVAKKQNLMQMLVLVAPKLKLIFPPSVILV
jgi:hypothetical protein